MTDASTVFVVDDDTAIRCAIASLLAELQIPVREFKNAAEFLDFYDDQPGCVLIDVRMPGMSGIALQESLIERGWNLPVIFVTGHGDIPMAVKTVKRGALDFLEKPFDPQELLDSIHRALMRDVQNRREAQPHRKMATDLSSTMPRGGPAHDARRRV